MSQVEKECAYLVQRLANLEQALQR